MQARFCPPARTRTALLTTTLLMSGLLWSGHAMAQGVAAAMPSGGQVIAGQATINGSGSQTVISQSSDRAIINWTDFSIGKGGEVVFNNGTGATLNRVTGGNLSSIDGLLNATGSVYLINPNGVIIGKSGVVNVGGSFVASALDLGNDDFLRGGDQTFSGPSLASVVNLGKIGALGGDVALMAINVKNSGAINAANGTVGLLAGHSIIMRDTAVDDGRFLIVTGGADTAATNEGVIAAASAELRAEGGNIYALAGNTSGVIRATGVSEKDGRVWLTAGADGSVNMSGSTVTATAANGDGGTISVTGGQIKVASDATLDASATSETGNGGTVNAIADMVSGDLTFAGKALSRTGSQGGNGGFVETSGHSVDFTGARVDTSAPRGRSGNWLVDPEDLTVDSASAATIQTNLATTDVTLQTTATTASGTGVSTSGSGDIIINSDITWSSANTLHLDSYHSIQVNANLTVSGAGGVVLSTNDDGSETGTGGGTGGDYSFALGKSLSFTGSGGSLTINGNSYNLLNSLSDIASLSGGASGYYALAKPLDASGMTYSQALVTGNFAGTLEGLGNTISNLTISSGGNGGLFEENSGVIRDIGVTNANIIGIGYSGGLAGVNYRWGVLQNVYVTGSVQSNFAAGGLVGDNYGTISNAFANASVWAANVAGGLVGYMDMGVLSNAYATGSVASNPYTAAGGVAGVNYATIENAYATGNMTSGTGGLVGDSRGGSTISNGYYDSDTTGQSDTRGTAQTTTQLQGALPAGFDSSIWGTGAGLYPYLKSFFPNGVVAVSGTTYDSSNTAVSSAAVTLYSGGSSLGTAYSGANGYYYIPVAAGTAGSSAGVTETLSGGSSVTGAAISDTASPATTNVTGLDVTSDAFNYYTALTTYSAFKTASAASTAFGSTYYTSLLSTLSSATYQINASNAFTIDRLFDTTGNIVVKTLSGDLTVSVDTGVIGAALTLDAHDNLYINANLTAVDASAVTLTTGDGGTGDYNFAPGKSLTFSTFSNPTSVGQALTINGQAYQLLYSFSDLQGIDGGGGYYALANSLDLSGTTFTDRPIESMDGNLTGLGHTIANLNINAPGSDSIGLFRYNTGILRDIGITDGTVYGNYYSGALVGENYGQIYNAYSSADMHVVYRSGGLVGVNYGLISRSHATGSVTSNGDNGGVSDMGGLVGWNDSAGTISQSYATGTVTGTANTTGGLVAFNVGTITDSFATGGVFGNLYAGGLVGFGDGTISNSYSTGYVHAATSGGGFAGHFTGTITNSYWDTTTSGTNIGVADGVTTGTPTGLARSDLQSGSLPTGFSSSIWATGSGLYPYLKALFPTGMQSISGTTRDNSGNALAAATLAVYINSTQVGGTTAASGADGYYYLMAQPGTVASGTAIGITETDHNGTAVTGLVYTDAMVMAGGQVTGFDVRSGRASYVTAQTTYNLMRNAASNTFGSNLTLSSADTYIVASNAFNFTTINPSFGGSLSITAAGGITLGSNQSSMTITTTGSATFGSAVTLGKDVTLVSSAVTFGSTVNGAKALTVNSSGATTFSGAVGGSTALTSLTTNAGGTTTLGGNVTTSGLQSYGDNMTLGADVGLTAGGALSLLGTVNGAHALTVKGTSLTLKGMGGTNALTSFSGKATSGNISVGGAINTTGTILLAANGTFSNTAGSGALNATGGFTVYTQNAGDPTGTIPVNSLGGLTATNYYNDAYDFNAGTFASAVPAGNHFVYAYAASLTPTLSGATTKTYNATTDADTTGLTVSGGTFLSAGDSVTFNIDSASYDTKNAGTGKTVTADISLSSNPNNYTLDNSTASAAVGNIDKATLVAGLTGTVEKTYDATTDASLTNANYTLSGVFGSDDVALNGPASGMYADKNAGTSKTVNVSGLALTGGDMGNYTVNTSAAGNIGAINQAALTLAAVTGTKTYDATIISAGTVGVSGLQGSDTVTGLSQSYDSKNAGARTLGVNGGYVVNDGNNGGDYTITTQTASGTIDKATLVAGLTGVVEKIYDATTDASLTNANYTLSGVFGSDDVALNAAASGMYADKNAGTGKTVNVSGLALTGGDMGNYTVNTSAAGNIGAINQAALTLAAVTGTKTYDATIISAGTVGISSLQGSDTVTGLSQSYDSKNAGARTLGVNGGYVVNDGNNGGNYTITTQTASGTIDKATLVAGLTGVVEKIYDATTDASLTNANYTLSGIIGSDSVTLNDPASGHYTDKNAGTGKTVTISDLALSGSDAGNYAVNSSAFGNIGTINKADLTLAAVSGTKTYDATTTSSGSVSVTGLQGSDAVTGVSQSYDSKNAGSGTLGVNGGYVVNDGNSGGNYTITTQTASGTIDKAILVAGLTGTVEKTYDATTDASLTNANYTLTGVIGDDRVNLDAPAAGSYSDTNAGAGKTVSISGLAVSGSDAGNYIVNTSAAVAVGVIDKRSVTIAADDIGKITGTSDPLLTWQMTLGSLVGGDTVSGGLDRAVGENPGNYAITQGSLAASDNYNVTFIGAKFTITPAGMQNQPVVNPVQSSLAPLPPFSSFSNNSESDSGSSAADGGDTGAGDPDAAGPNTGHNASSSDTCTDGGACSNQPYPGNQSFSSYVSFLSH